MRVRRVPIAGLTAPAIRFEHAFMRDTERPEVFVYGTLMPGGRYWGAYCAGRVSAVLAAKVRGSVYALELGYPGARFDETGWIHGYRLTFATPDGLGLLDQLEGYRADREPAQNEYQRVRVPCFERSGRELGLVWSYEMAQSKIAAHGGVRVESGEWTAAG